MPSKNEAAQMVAGVEGMVRQLAVRYSRISNGRVDAMELAQLGRFAAFMAVESFDASERAAFSTYAYAAMRNAMGNEIRKAAKAKVSLDICYGAERGDEDGCYVDGLTADGLLPDAACEAAEKEAQVRSIVERVKAEHYAKKPELFEAVVARLMAAVEVSDRYGGDTQRSDITLESIALQFGITREWVRRTETLVKGHLAAALSEVE